MSTAEEQRIGGLLAPEIGELIAQRHNYQARTALTRLLEPEIADVLPALEPEHRAVAFRLLKRQQQADVFVLLPTELQEQLLEELNNEQLANLFNEIDPDDRAELFEEMPGELATKLLSLMRPEERRRTQVILGYPEDSVGRLMTPELLTVRADWTAGQALEHIRRHGRKAESLDTLFVVDSRGRLVDHIRLSHLIFAEPEEPVGSLVGRQTVALQATDHREEAVRAMERYDTPVLPVVDRDDVLVGIVTFDDVADVAEAEMTEDMQKLGGMEALDEPYMATGLVELIRKRVIWLTILFIGGLGTIVAMSQFEAQLNEVVALALFVPLIIASGGNSGTQAASLIIRAIAIGEVTLRDWGRVVVRELITGLTMGLVLGALGWAVVVVATRTGWIETVQREHLVAMTIAVSVLGVVTCGTIIGSSLPFLLRAMNLDPAAGSTPLVATVSDVSGLVIYFTAAMLILGL